jgi:hypothetical protein
MAMRAPPKYSQSSASHLSGAVKYSLVSSIAVPATESAARPAIGMSPTVAHANTHPRRRAAFLKKRFIN